MNICEHLVGTARIFPESEAISFEGERLTYAQLDRRSAAASAVLLTAGVRQGDRVAIMLPNVPAFAVWYFAALRMGAIAVSISTRSASSEVAFLVDDCQATFFVSDEATLGRVSNELPECVANSVFTSDLGDTSNEHVLEPAASSRSTWVETDPDDPAVILYTSGTTGFAKGATLSHRNVRSNVHAFNHLCNMQPSDRILLAVPLFHCFGQNALLNSAFNVGATLVLQRRFDLNESKRLIADEQVTQLYGVPMMFQLFLDCCGTQDLSTVEYCFSAAATLPLQVSQQWQQKFGMPINEGYGLTETSPFASYNHRLQFVPGSIGTPIDCVEMKIVNTETGEDCLPDELGEIVVRGPNVMLGYWNRDEESQAVIRDGWFHSGDIGRRDERGYFYIVDRVKDMISVGGLKVYPAEVERVLLDHPAVAEIAVVGIDDDVFGEQVVAFVVRPSDQSPASEEVASILQHAKEHLANYKVPRIVVPIGELPRNPSGKVLKRELRKFDFHKHGVAIDSAPPADEIAGRASRHNLRPATLRPATLRHATLRHALETTHASNRQRVALEFVRKLVQTIAGTDELPNEHDRFLEVGLDSLMIVEMSNQIQIELGPDQEVPATVAFDYPRISDLSDHLIDLLVPAEHGEDDRFATEDGVSNLRGQIETMSEDEALQELMKELDE